MCFEDLTMSHVSLLSFKQTVPSVSPCMPTGAFPPAFHLLSPGSVCLVSVFSGVRCPKLETVARDTSWGTASALLCAVVPPLLYLQSRRKLMKNTTSPERWSFHYFFPSMSKLPLWFQQLFWGSWKNWWWSEGVRTNRITVILLCIFNLLPCLSPSMVSAQGGGSDPFKHNLQSVWGFFWIKGAI